MKPLPTPRRLLQLNALFARRDAAARAGLAGRTEPRLDAQDTRMPDDVLDPAELLLMAYDRLHEPAHDGAGTQLGRLAAEVALEEGGRRLYAPREESEVIERRRESEARRV